MERTNMTGKKQVYGDFEYLLSYCQCPCHNLINLNKKRFREYERHGYPEYINGHWIRTEEAKCKHIEKNGFKKGKSPWNLGLTKETDNIMKIISEKLTGKSLSEEHINKLSGENHWDSSGKNNPNWQGGTSFGKYCPKFNNIKREEIRNKYNRECIICNKSESENLTKSGNFWKLHVHHVDYNKNQGCNGHKWMLVPLCLSCHAKTNNGNKKEWENKIINIINNGD